MRCRHGERLRPTLSELGRRSEQLGPTGRSPGGQPAPRRRGTIRLHLHRPIGRRTTVRPRMPNGRRTPRRRSLRSISHASWPARESRVPAISAGHPGFERPALEMPVAASVALLDQPEEREQDAPEVSILEDLQTGPPGLGGELPTGIAPHVPEKAVVVVVGPRAGGHHQHGPSARAQDATQLGQRQPVARHVLEQIGAHRRVDAGVPERQRAHVGLQQASVGDVPVCHYAVPTPIRSTPISCASGSALRRSSSR